VSVVQHSLGTIQVSVNKINVCCSCMIIYFQFNFSDLEQKGVKVKHEKTDLETEYQVCHIIV